MRSEEPSASSSVVRGLNSSRSTERINQIDQVRAYRIGDVVSLPQLVVCGDQSAGKSSVLESVTNIPFPRKSGLCTRFPTEIILRHNSTATRIMATIHPHASRPQEKRDALLQYRRVLADISELPDVIEQVSALMEIRGYADHSLGNAFASDVLRIEFVGQTNLNLTIVDLPGLISVANEEQTEEDIQLVKDMVKGYVQSSRTIVLAVVQATNDIANQVIIQLARHYDPEARPAWRSLRTIRPTSSSNLAFSSLKNPKPSEIEEGIKPEQRSQRELRLFSEPVWKQHLDMSRVGAENLKLFLQDLLDAHIEKEMPQVVEDIRKVLHTTEESLTRLGQARPTVGHIRIFLTQVSTSFVQMVQAALDGNYHGPYYESFDHVEDSRLRAVVHKTNGKFATDIRTHGKKRVLRPVESEIDWTLDENSIKENNEKELFVTQEEMKNWVKKVCPYMVVESGTTDMVQVYLRTRGRELPGNYNHVLLAELFLEQSSRWLPIATAHVESIIAIVTGWLQHATRVVLPED
ncbi:dynamin GTPase [Pyricularia oryzae 70-15]|uniref:Dynamin GTPase n=1 Tax=Pyricularia oryzae (strain 70-15 / ATCC MYA-4617 / FGSC 8958) TaxID=242507 RepID=G4NGJ9_PYRO7|nr:dynamin GTPase [Pyricularia oryzae 70-15]EHA47155.1 dynamin GTPase [Pyricularia oryzae 70-15]